MSYLFYFIMVWNKFWNKISKENAFAKLSIIKKALIGHKKAPRVACGCEPRDAIEHGNDSCTFVRVATGAEVPFPKSIIAQFIVYKDRLQINLFQPFAVTQKIQRGLLYLFYYLSGQHSC